MSSGSQCTVYGASCMLIDVDLNRRTYVSEINPVNFFVAETMISDVFFTRTV